MYFRHWTPCESRRGKNQKKMQSRSMLRRSLCQRSGSPRGELPLGRERIAEGHFTRSRSPLRKETKETRSPLAHSHLLWTHGVKYSAVLVIFFWFSPKPGTRSTWRFHFPQRVCPSESRRDDFHSTRQYRTPASFGISSEVARLNSKKPMRSAFMLATSVASAGVPAT